jgi:hypothetical protein
MGGDYALSFGHFGKAAYGMAFMLAQTRRIRVGSNLDVVGGLDEHFSKLAFARGYVGPTKYNPAPIARLVVVHQ